MARYILLMNWTDQGVKNVRESPGRLDAGRALAKKMGCELREFYMTAGTSDMVAIVEAPDDATLGEIQPHPRHGRQCAHHNAQGLP